MQVITSKDNEQIKYIKKLKDKKYRDEFGEYIIEGVKTVQEAIMEKAEVALIVVCDDCEKQGIFDQKFLYEVAKYNCIYVNQKVFETITEVQNPQGVLAIISKKESKNKIDYSKDFICVLDSVQDPGNLGTIIRTLDSAGIGQIVISKGSVDAYLSKVVRSTMGAIFRVEIVEVENLENTIKDIKKKNFKIVATSLETEKSIYNIEYKKTAIVIGNEANGISEKILNLADEKVKIPMLGRTESLNASVAAGIIVYEYVRQKGKYL